MIMRAQGWRGRPHISKKFSKSFRNARMQRAIDSVNRRQFADLSSRSRSSRFHVGRAYDGVKLVAACVAVGSGCVRR